MDDGRGQPLPLGIGDDVGDAGLHRGDRRVGGAQINADNVIHPKNLKFAVQSSKNYLIRRLDWAR
jgi:hypothetical protein